MATVRVRRCGFCKESGHNIRTCSQKIAAQESSQLPTQTETQVGTQAGAPASQIVDGKENLGSISIGAKQVFVSLLPSQSESVIVKYNPEIQVSCVIPPQQFKINYAQSRHQSKRELEITTPTLIMSCGYGDVPGPASYKRVLRPYTLWAIDTTRQNQIYAKSYLFANVWQNGNICFGALKPGSLRQAYNYFWSSNFNAELYREDHTCNKKAHLFIFHTGCKCDPTKKNHTCSCPRITFHRHYGCGCTNVGNSKSCRGACSYTRDNPDLHGCECCTAIHAVQAAARLENPSISQRQLKRLCQIEGADFPECGCSYRHKRGCSCGKNYCNCECRCACCTETCSHEVCVCSCCKNDCNCRCDCSPSEKFHHHMKIYHDELLPKQKWKKLSDLFCGTKYWASPKSAAGILLSNNKNLLNQIPRKYWRRDSHGNALLVALADKKDDYWYFESGGFTFQLHEANVVSK